jgi:SAM-dependent methyltransferase
MGFKCFAVENKFINRIKLWGKRILFPGLDLHTRCRYRFLPLSFRDGAINTLDAGCGNGALAYKAYKLGNNVLAISNEVVEIEHNRIYFTALGVDQKRLQFELYDLNDLSKLNRKFEQIICSETLEHVKKDSLILRYFYDLLEPEGILHLCCPFAHHPDAQKINIFSAKEDGNHMRNGYTLESYRALLGPIGFDIVYVSGIGSPFLVKLDKFVRFVRARWGDLAAIPIFLITLPLQALDYQNDSVPFSLYVKSVKRPLPR